MKRLKLKRKIIKDLQLLHKNALRKGRIPRTGLCRVMESYHIGDMFNLIFRPNAEERKHINLEKTSQMYWGSDEYNSFTIKTTTRYTVRRQHLLLLMIELLKDKDYMKKHFGKKILS